MDARIKSGPDGRVYAPPTRGRHTMMSAIRRSFDLGAFIPDHMRDGMRRVALFVGGCVLLLTVAATGASLATWSVHDPSLTHATNAPVRNLLGRPGASVADLLMQLWGAASVALLFPVAVWGWRLTSGRPIDRERMRLGLWVVGALGAAAFASCLPPTPGWPLPTGLGGVVGDGLLRAPTWLTGSPMGSWTRILLATLSGSLALFALAFAAGLTWRREHQGGDEDIDDDLSGDAERGLFWGRVVHAWLSLRSRAARVFSFVRLRWNDGDDALAPLPRRGAGQRIEPRWRDAPAVELPRDQRHAAPEPEPEEDEVVEAPPRARKPRAPKSKRADDGYELPPINLLAVPKIERSSITEDMLQSNAQALEGVLGDFGVRGEIINARPGPVVTLYELEPAPGIKSSRVIGLADDIARSMSAISARVAVVSGRNAIGIELPNPKREKVFLRELLSSDDYVESSAKLPLCLGKTIGGEPVIVDLARMPHLLIAGTTGSGKSVGINTMILSIVYRLKPDQCRLIMIDPKMLELSVYDGIPHLLTPVVTDPKKAVVALKWAVREMEDRYRKMSKLGVRNLDGYNARVAEAKTKGETLSRTVHTGYDKESGEAIYEEEMLDLEPLPFVVVIVDEMADLMMVAGKDIEGAIQRLAQMARAAGIHVILATQRPSVDVITGTIKANFPTRISFQVTSKIDSRTILGEQGAEQLLGQGDMLYMAGGGRISRVHGPFVSDEEVEKVVRHLKAQGAPQYLESVTISEDEDEDGGVFDATAMGAEDARDPYAQAVQVVLRDRKASTSYIQRRLQIGYNRAASIMERMEKEGIVGAPNHAGKREILVGGEDE
jgi:DNA segregation ATPase FtsK/SpoIIIE, S-DNA-T family